MNENKDLLLKYLCMALPYGVIIHIHNINVDDFDNYLYENYLLQIRAHEIIAKPYLRPMSSMTEEDKKEMHNLLSPEGTAIYENSGIALPLNHYGEFVPYEFMNRIIQYLLEHHFDFIGLIPKDLAIEVTENNNPYK